MLAEHTVHTNAPSKVALQLGAAPDAAQGRLAWRGAPFNALMGWAPVTYVGRLSYPIYLWHWPIFVAAKGEGQLTGWVALLAVLGSVGAAALPYHAIEGPVRRWRPVAGSASTLTTATSGPTRSSPSCGARTTNTTRARSGGP